MSQLVKERMAAFPASGEINKTIADPAALLKKVQERYEISAKSMDFTDGLSMTFEDWRFNLRMSNTEPVVRLNVESRADVLTVTGIAIASCSSTDRRRSVRSPYDDRSRMRGLFSTRLGAMVFAPYALASVHIPT